MLEATYLDITLAKSGPLAILKDALEIAQPLFVSDQKGVYFKILVEGFCQVKKVKSINDLLELIGVPQLSRDDLIDSMPSILKDERMYNEKDFPNYVYKWFRNIFYNTPGFLYNNEWASTLIGVKVSKFEKYYKHLNSALYQGIWSNPNELRWWKSVIYELILKTSDDFHPWELQRNANLILKVNEEDKSTCYKCGEEWPEIIAQIDESSSEFKQVHLRCSKRNHLVKAYQYYEEPRIIV